MISKAGVATNRCPASRISLSLANALLCSLTAAFGTVARLIADGLGPTATIGSANVLMKTKVEVMTEILAAIRERKP
jgi:hypothetical protein